MKTETEINRMAAEAMTLDTKNLTNEQLAEIQKQIDKFAAKNKHKLPFHLRMPKYGQGYCFLNSCGDIEEEDTGLVWDNDAIDKARRDYGNASLDVSFLEFTNEQRRAYIKILRFIATHEIEQVNVVGEIGWTVCLCSDGDPHIERRKFVPNSIPKLKRKEDVELLVKECADEIRTVLSWYVPEVKNDD